MPPRYVKTIGDEIFYEYAKLISRAAKGHVDYGFVTNRFKALRDGEIRMSDTISEWFMERRLEHACVYCGNPDNLTADHLVPKSRGGDDSSDNIVSACRKCNVSRGNKGVFVWLGRDGKENIHRVVAGKYLKLLLEMHIHAGTVDIPVAELQRLCNRCGNGTFCERDGCVGKLTCYCLESIF